MWGALWTGRGNYAARPGNIKVVAVVAALLLPPPQRKFQLYFELSAVCSYANMRNCISRSQEWWGEERAMWCNYNGGKETKVYWSCDAAACPPASDAALLLLLFLDPGMVQFSSVEFGWAALAMVILGSRD